MTEIPKRAPKEPIPVVVTGSVNRALALKDYLGLAGAIIAAGLSVGTFLLWLQQAFVQQKEFNRIICNIQKENYIQRRDIDITALQKTVEDDVSQLSIFESTHLGSTLSQQDQKYKDGLNGKIQENNDTLKKITKERSDVKNEIEKSVCG